MSRAALLAIALTTACALPLRAQTIDGKVVALGLPVSQSGGNALREGQWFPVLVDLTARGDHFQGKLRIVATDLDGDRVEFLEEPVAVTANSTKRVWCYAVAFGTWFGGIAGGFQGALRVDVLDEEGRLVTSLEAPATELLSSMDDPMVVLDLSSLKTVGNLESLGRGGTDQLPGARLYRRVHYGALDPADLPDRWWGLEMVDVIVWDQPDTSALSGAQIVALKQWVRNGGRLVVGIGSSWQTIQAGPLAELMPFEPGGTVVQTDDLPGYAARYLKERTLDKPLTVITAAPRAAATVTLEDGRYRLVARMNVGSGRVIACATSLRDLLARASDELYFHFFDVNLKEPEFAERESNTMGMLAQPLPLFKDLVEPTSFTGMGARYALAVFGFVVAYIGLATLASWLWLKKHGRTQLSWTVFAVFAVAASVVSIGLVGLTRGVVGKVRSVEIVDLEAGSREARAACWFGYRSPRRQKPDISLPGKGNYLRALNRRPENQEYATPERYAALTGKAVLRETPMRATLKQFEGYWTGEIDGTVRGRISIDRRTGRVRDSSWIQNDLPVDLADGYLLYADPRGRARPPAVIAGNNQGVGPKWSRFLTVPPSVNIVALQVPAMKSGDRIQGFGAAFYEGLDKRLGGYTRRSQPDVREPDLMTLWELQYACANGGSFIAQMMGATQIDPPWGAALMLSTRNYYLPSASDFSRLQGPVTAQGLVQRDVMHWLSPGQGVLLLVSADPGPVALHIDGDPKQAESGRSVYRVRVAIEMQ